MGMWIGCQDEYGDDYGDEYGDEYGGDLHCDFFLSGSARADGALTFDVDAGKEVNIRQIDWSTDSDSDCMLYTILVSD
jgi:hypothetical protein